MRVSVCVCVRERERVGLVGSVGGAGAEMAEMAEMSENGERHWCGPGVNRVGCMDTEFSWGSFLFLPPSFTCLFLLVFCFFSFLFLLDLLFPFRSFLGGAFHALCRDTLAKDEERAKEA